MKSPSRLRLIISPRGHRTSSRSLVSRDVHSRGRQDRSIGNLRRHSPELTNDNLATIGKIVEVARPLLHPALRRLMVSTACAPAGRHLPRRGRGFRRCRRGLTVNPGIVSVIDTATPWWPPFRARRWRPPDGRKVYLRCSSRWFCDAGPFAPSCRGSGPPDRPVNVESRPTPRLGPWSAAALGRCGSASCRPTFRGDRSTHPGELGDFGKDRRRLLLGDVPILGRGLQTRLAREPGDLAIDRSATAAGPHREGEEL
jgi:hypothetical protein